MTTTGEKTPDLVSVEMAGSLLGCSRRRVFQLLKSGALERGESKWGKAIAIRGATVDALIGRPRRHREARAYSRVQAERQLRTLYGIDFEDWARLFDAQGRKCPGCCSALEFNPNTHVDHCHSTGAVRGLLCEACNHALGKVRDSVETLNRLARYLLTHNEPTMTGAL